MNDNVELVYTDGSAVILRNQSNINGPGGFGTYFPNLMGKPRAYSLGFKSTKTGRMEIMALYYAIIALPIDNRKNIILRVYSDSQYVVKTFTEKRLERWIAAGWRNSSGDVKNRDLWEKVLSALNNRKYIQLDLRHIKSHQVDREKDPEKKKLLLKDPHIRGNMIADILADYKRHKILLESDIIN